MKNKLIKRMENNLRDKTVYKHFCIVCSRTESFCMLTCKNFDEVMQAHFILENFE